MKDGPDIAHIAALIGDPARSNMLTALMDGRALTASELAAEAGVSASTATSHLSRLRDGGLLQLRRRGRHRYFALADDQVARVLEGLMGLSAGLGRPRTRTGPRDEALREARVCYNHLAGTRGIQLYESMTARGLLVGRGDQLEPGADAPAFLGSLGLDVEGIARGRAPLCRECLDWSERRMHLAGSLGRAVLARIEALGWVRRDPGSRAVLFSESGSAAFDRAFPPPA